MVFALKTQRFSTATCLPCPATHARLPRITPSTAIPATQTESTGLAVQTPATLLVLLLNHSHISPAAAARCHAMPKRCPTPHFSI